MDLGVEKTIDYIFVSGNLFSAIASHQVCSVSNFFDTNHNAILVLIGLSGFLNVHLNSLNCTSAKLLVIVNKFSGTEFCGDINAIWAILEKIMMESANKVFSRHWFSKFQCLRNKHSSKFFGLELLVAKVVRKFSSDNMPKVDCLVKIWSTLDDSKAHIFTNVLCSEIKSVVVLKHLSLACKKYRKSKMHESRLAEEAFIRKAITEHMKNFCSNKDSMIRSILEQFFCKVVLNHLVVDDGLVLKLEKIKLSINKIIEDWTKKHTVFSVLPDYWAYQYAPLAYVRDDAFSNVMCTVSINKLLLVVGGLLDGKATGLSSIPNKL
ncbi:hypothetical protein G9A89_020522 [Geosiphon pyriformis]|nr:hypothetical protein G9A89_020522 [Geosiphon pyriformis]